MEIKRYNCTRGKWWMKWNSVTDGKVGGWVGYVGGGHCTVHSLDAALSPSIYSLVIRDQILDPTSTPFSHTPSSSFSFHLHNTLPKLFPSPSNIFFLSCHTTKSGQKMSITLIIAFRDILLAAIIITLIILNHSLLFLQDKPYSLL